MGPNRLLLRVLSFQLLAFITEKLWITYVAIAVHVLLTVVINFLFLKFFQPTNEIKEEKRWWQGVLFWKNLLLNGMGNIYVPWSDGTAEEHTIIKDIIAEVINLVETLAISIWATQVCIRLPFLEENKSNCLIAIWSCYSCYILIKTGFFLFLHPWSDLIKHHLFSTFRYPNRKGDKVRGKSKNGQVKVCQ